MFGELETKCFLMSVRVGMSESLAKGPRLSGLDHSKLFAVAGDTVT